MKKILILFLLLFLVFSISFAAPKCDDPPCGDPPGQGGDPPGQGGDPPGQGGDPPGQGGDPPGGGPPCGTPPCGQGPSGGSTYLSSDDVGLLPIFLTPFKEPSSGVSISIQPARSATALQAGPPKTTHNRQVTLKLNGGLEATKMTISNFPDMRSDGQENYSSIKKWDLCSKSGGFITFPSCPNGTYTVYAKFYNQYGQCSPMVSASIKLVNNQKVETGFGSVRQLAQAIHLTQLQTIDLLKELIETLKNQIKLLFR